MILKMQCLLVFLATLITTCASADDWIPKIYRVEVITPGGALPFMLHTDEEYIAPGDPDYESRKSVVPISPRRGIWFLMNGEERIRRLRSKSHWETHGSNRSIIGRVSRRTENTTTILFDEYDSQIQWTRWISMEYPGENNSRSEGVWRKKRGTEYVELPILVTEVDWQVPATDDRRFAELDLAGFDKTADHFTGRWSVSFESAQDLAIGDFEVDSNGIARGTFLTTTGDYRYLAGRVDGPFMRLSTFDGAHAFLFHARMQDDGTIAGDFWSGNWWHETWTAERDPDAQLPDMFEQTTVADADSLDDLTFKALDGTPTKVADLLDATGAPARVLYIFGTWCPNCADAAAELKRLKDLHGDDLRVVGLAFELTDDHKRSATQVNRYLERHGGTWPILIAGLSDKSKASAELPILDKIRSYPTTIFLNSDNEIVSVHTGFTGPATGEAFSDQQREYERIIAELISEQP